MTQRPALHCYLSDDAHETWHAACRAQGISVSALLEALAPELPEVLENWPEMVKEAREVDATRRRRIR